MNRKRTSRAASTTEASKWGGLPKKEDISARWGSGTLHGGHRGAWRNPLRGYASDGKKGGSFLKEAIKEGFRPFRSDKGGGEDKGGGNGGGVEE